MTVAALLVAHAALNVEVPFPLLVGTVILSVVLPRSRSVVAVTLSALYGLVLLPVGLAYALFKGRDPGEYLTGLLAKVTSLLDGVQLPAWAATPAPASAPASVVAHGSDLSQGTPAQAVPSRSADLLPPARNVARQQKEPVYDGVFLEMAGSRPNGQTDIVDIRRSRGRHAKPESERAEELVTA